MGRFLSVCGLGVFSVVLLGHAIPAWVFQTFCLGLLALVAALFLLFHLGIRDFQGY